MVAIIHNSASLRNAFHYNENKVQRAVAQCIVAGNYPKEVSDLTIRDKINRMQKLTALNQRTKINSVHISLNFDSTERLLPEKLEEIVQNYMNKIGFGEQPYLVYQHHDAGHPHLHIVTTNIKADGSRISLHNLGKNQSFKASLEIEKEFGLVKALGRQKDKYNLKSINFSKAVYGKSETKKAITTVLDAVLPHYKYASLAELNAVLRLYNVHADRGSEGSRTHRSNGLVFRILNEKGEKVGVPVKASLIYNKPLLRNISARFEENKEARQPHKQHLKKVLDFIIQPPKKLTISSLQSALQKKRIHLVLRQNEDGIVYGLTYVDHKTKCIFNGSDLGKEYSANAINKRCGIDAEILVSQKKNSNLQNKVEDGIEVKNSFNSYQLFSTLTEEQNTATASELKGDNIRARKKKRHQL